MRALLRAQRLACEEVMDWPGVTGIAIGKKMVRGQLTDHDSIIIYVEKKLPPTEVEYILPQAIGDVPTDVVETGRITIQAKPTDRLRPAPGGCSVGHYKITAGTLGAICFDRKTKEPMILSNNHILANTTNGKDGRSAKDDPILQPGPYDGGQPTDVIGRLERVVPLNFESGSGWRSSCIFGFLERIWTWLGAQANSLRDSTLWMLPLPGRWMRCGWRFSASAWCGCDRRYRGHPCYKSGRTTGVTT